MYNCDECIKNEINFFMKNDTNPGYTTFVFLGNSHFSPNDGCGEILDLLIFRSISLVAVEPSSRCSHWRDGDRPLAGRRADPRAAAAAPPAGSAVRPIHIDDIPNEAPGRWDRQAIQAHQVPPLGPPEGGDTNEEDEVYF